MRTLYLLSVVGIIGVVSLTVAIPETGAPSALIALYNLWLLATVTLVVATIITLCFRFFSLITSGHNR
jgi:hypothetical protein